ncbi:BA75_00883T0 [Komagataella pastoris]|uniref:BA75_00883T0 n=1 Tax=Komagataella pastoris TaxID=4922 RepID=A0A1B2J9V3_PICPA|nr:BA75_00883T0 [Komagataella pastoris]
MAQERTDQSLKENGSAAVSYSPWNAAAVDDDYSSLYENDRPSKDKLPREPSSRPHSDQNDRDTHSVDDSTAETFLQQHLQSMMHSDPDKKIPPPNSSSSVPVYPVPYAIPPKMSFAIQQGMVPPPGLVQYPQNVLLQQKPRPNATPVNNKNSRRPKVQKPKFRPCDVCRRRKTKCARAANNLNCQQCEAKGLKCTYTDNPKRPQDIPSDQASKRARQELPPNIPIRDIQPVIDYSTIQGHSLLKKTLSLQYPRSSFYMGPTSVYDPLLLSKMRFDNNDQLQVNSITSIRRVANNVQFLLKDDFSHDLYQRAQLEVDNIEKFVAPHGQTLIDLYFRIVHPSFPILHKKVFLEKYSRTHREFSAPLLGAVYILAINWWDYDPNLSLHPKPNVKGLMSLATRSFDLVTERPKLSTVQAGLLLLQCDPTSSKNWVLCSQVVALSEELGLGLDCFNWKLPKWERGLRRRLAWAVFVQEKWLALLESRPTHIALGTNWIISNVMDDDFPDKNSDEALSMEGSTDTEIGKQIFKQMIKLTEILSDILDTFFSFHSLQTITSIEQVLTLAKPLQLRLRDWYHALPQDLQMSSLQQRKLNSNGYLQLSYFAAEISLHRRIISCLDSGISQELVTVCRNAAKTRLSAAIDFVKQLQPEHIHSFWHSSATSNFALIGSFASMLFVTAPTTDDANWCKDQLYEYRWTLLIGSKASRSYAMAMEIIDNIMNNIPELLNHYKTPQSTTSNNRTPLSETQTPDNNLGGNSGSNSNGDGNDGNNMNNQSFGIPYTPIPPYAFQGYGQMPQHNMVMRDPWNSEQFTPPSPRNNQKLSPAISNGSSNEGPSVAVGQNSPLRSVKSEPSESSPHGGANSVES